MSLMEKMTELGKSVLTSDVEFRQIRTTLAEVNQELKKVIERVNNLSERVVKLEVSREADRAEMAAELARFKIEVERAEMKLTKLLPPSSDSGK
jgi:uncharacterized protein involved in exopolysaccharide biosynthesis